MESSHSHPGPMVPLMRWIWWALVVVGVVAASVAWSTSSPVGSSPDEDAHITYAWGTATGQTLPWNSVESEGANGAQLVQVVVPPALEDRPTNVCYKFNSSAPACDDPVGSGEGGDVLTSTYMARYPPVYYALVGVFLRAGLAVGMDGAAVLIAARIWSGILCGAVLACSFAMMWRRFGGVPVVAAAAVTTTPMVLSLANAINPNGFEIVCAVAVAATVVSVRHDIARSGTVGRGIQVFLVVTAFGLALARPASIAWLGLLGLLLVLPVADGSAASGGRVVPLRRLSVWGTVLTLVAVAVGLVWFVYENSTRSGGASDQDLDQWRALPWYYRWIMVVLRFGTMLHEGYGLLGWLDTPLPLLFFLVWLVSSVLVVGRLATGVRSDTLAPRWAWAFLVACCVVVAVQSNHSAFGWQGRYFLPALFAFVVLLVPAMADTHAVPRSRPVQAAVLLVVAGVLDFGALLYDLFRYLYGYSQLYLRFDALPIPTPNGEWVPVIGRYTPLALALAAVVSLVSAGAVLLGAPHRTGGAPSPVRTPDAVGPAAPDGAPVDQDPVVP